MNVWIVTVVLIAAGQAQDARPPLAAMNRLALAAATRAEGDSPEVSARRARLESLAAFTRSFTARTERGQASDLFNYMQVVRDTVDAGPGSP